MIHISLTFDHRVLDGMYGCGFLGAFKKHLEQDHPPPVQNNLSFRRGKARLTVKKIEIFCR